MFDFIIEKVPEELKPIFVIKGTVMQIWKFQYMFGFI